MIINNKDIKKFGATLLDYDIENSEIVNYNDWLDGSFTPDTHRQLFKFSYITCTFLIRQKNTDLAEIMISNFIKHSSKAILDIECLSRKYKGVIEDVTKEKITRGIFELEVKWKTEYSFKEEPEFILEGKSGSVFVPGNEGTPAFVEIMPLVNMIDLTINGLGDDILLKNLTKDKIIIIDGEKGQVSEEGKNKYMDYDSWGFPYLVPGENTISIDRDNVDVKIKYKSRWI
ncbi:MAG TPA: hypothetical protein VK071_11610 [Tissierellales bacterium]|nr:hypothetical protein [Tissierellales bacterium]